MTMPGVGAGARGFAAPETWIDGRVADEQADVYSLGRIAAWLRTWPSPSPMSPAAGWPMRGLIVERTQHEPDRRIPSMAAFLERLDILRLLTGMRGWRRMRKLILGHRTFLIEA